MTLYKQLWIAIIVALSMIFVGSLFVSSLSAQQYLEEQVSAHNQNYANFLALLLNSQCALETCDEAHLSTWLKPPIDQGYILSIQVISPLGDTLFSDNAIEKTGTAPAWFKKTFPLKPDSGGVNIQSGWTALGELTLTSPIEDVYDEMWEGSINLSQVYFLAMLLAGSIGSYLLGRVLKPLDDVVNQAQALGERRFITTAEPWTLDFKKVVSAMNTLATRVKEMLEQEADTLNEYRRDLHTDKVTRLLNRDQFMSIFRATLARDDASGSGALSILRVSDLGGLNQTFGYPKVDAMLTDLGDAVRWLTNINGGWTAARLNGSDLMILAPALKQRSKLYAEADDYFEIVPANRIKQSSVDSQGNTSVAKPSIHIQVLSNDQSSAAESIILTQHPDMGEVNYAGQGLFIYSCEIGVEGETEFSFNVNLDGEAIERSIQVTMASINDPLSVARELQALIRDVFKQHGMLEATQLPTAAIYFDPGDQLAALMTALDEQIRASEAEALSHIKIAYMGDMTAELSRELMTDWKSVFETAFEEESFELDLAEVTGMDGSLLHYEANVRLRQAGSVFRGGEFLPWITRLNMTEQLDREMVLLALDEIKAKGKPIAVKLSAEVIREPAFAAWFEEALSRRGHQHPLLSLQLLEPMAFRYLESFTGLCALARRYGIQTGIEHMGHQMEDIGRLFDVGINFMKIDEFFVTDIDNDVGNQNLVRSLATLAHSIGVIAIAQGVSTQEERTMIEKLGLDGASGPGISVSE